MTDENAQEEIDALVEGVVDETRREIAEENQNLIQGVVERMKDQPFRDLNVVFSEIRRRIEEVKE